MFIRKMFTICLAAVFLFTIITLPIVMFVPAVGATSGNVNVALNKPIEASSEVSSSHRAATANDGNTNSYYESQFTLPQTLTLDLETVFYINKIVMKLPASWSARSMTLAIQGSIDHSQFNDIVASATYSFSPSGGNSMEVTFDAVNARYIRLQFTGRSDRSAAAMGELEVYTEQNTPDLVATDITWLPLNPQEGDNVTFSASIKNVGDFPTPAGTGHKAAFRIDGQTIALTNAYNSTIAPGETVTMTASSTWTAEKYSFDIQAVADGEGAIGESNEDNNGDYFEVMEMTSSGWHAYFNLKEELGIYNFPEEQISYTLDFTGFQVQKEHLRLQQRGILTPVDYQLSDIVESNGYLVSASIHYRTSLSLGEIKRFVVDSDSSFQTPIAVPLSLNDNGDGTASISGNLQMIMVPYGIRNYDQVPLSSVPAPLLAIARQSDQWIGTGSFTAPSTIKVSSIDGHVVDQGPLFIKYQVSYVISGNRTYTAVLTVYKNEKHITVDETYSGFNSSDGAYFKFSYLNGIDPDGRIVLQNAGYSRYSQSNPGGYSGKYDDMIDSQGKLPYELGMYAVNAGGIMHSTSFWKDSGENAILFAVNQIRDWKTETRQYYQSPVGQNLRFYQSQNNKYMSARIEGGERHWAISIIPRDEMMMSGRRFRDWTIPSPVIVDSNWTQIPVASSFQPGNTPDVKLWQKLADLSLNRYKDMIFDFPEDVSLKLEIPYLTNKSMDTPTELWDGLYSKFKFYYFITDKFWDISSELGGAAWGGRGQRTNYSDYAYNRDKPAWTLSKRKQARSLLVYYTYTVEDDNNLPHTSMLGGHPNFNMDIKQMLGMAAGMYPQHPHAERWKQEFMKDYNEVMEVWSRKATPSLNSEGGRWYENLPTYTNASFLGILAAHEGLMMYDGTNLFQNENLKSVLRWVMNSLTPIERGDSYAAIPIGAHSNGGSPGGEFDGLYKVLAEVMIESEPVLGNQLLWMATNGAEGIKPELESTLYTDYGPVLRYDTGGPNEAFVYLQQLNDRGYRWSTNTNGVIYYTADGKRWSWNGTEDNGDAIDFNKLPIMNVNGKGLGPHLSDGVLYNFGNVQYYKAQASSQYSPYLSRSVMMVQDRYIALYDDMDNPSTNGEFVWANRESGLKEELYDNTDFTSQVSVRTDNKRFPATGSWGNAAPDPSMNADDWSIRWTGSLMPDYSEAFTFIAGTSAGSSAKVWVDGQLAIDTSIGFVNAISMNARDLHDFKVEYVHTSGPASLTLRWSSASQSSREIQLKKVYRELEQQPHIYAVKEGPGDEHHIVATGGMSVTSNVYGAVVDGNEYVFNSDIDQQVRGEIVSFDGKVGFAGSDELYLFEGTNIEYDGFGLARTGGDFGVSAKRINQTSIMGRFAGKSGGTVVITPPSGFSFDHVQIEVDGMSVPYTIANGTISFLAEISQSEGYKSFHISSELSALFYDDFEDSDSIGWLPNSGDWQPVANGSGYVYRQTGSINGATTSGSNDWSDYAVQARVKKIQADQIDLLGRYTDGNNFYYLQLDWNGNKVKLYRKVSGSVTLVQSVPLQLATERTYNVRLSFLGSSIQGLIDGDLLIDVTDNSMNAGKIGLRASSTAEFDDVAVFDYVPTVASAE